MAIQFFGRKLTSFQTVIIGFLGLILIGTGLLMLPISARDGHGASLEDALFTSTSAVCVTGLVVKDTAAYWTGFGQAVILILIQIGGLGIVSVAAFIAMISGRKISLFQRSMLQDSLSAHQIGGVVKMTEYIIKIALTAEVSGALVMMPVFCGQYGVSGIWLSVFHSVSAFCNAGFDIMGDKTGPSSSLTSYAASPGIIIPVGLLIVIGGIGFLTWEDIALHKLHFNRYRMQSKVVIVTTAVLITGPLLLLFLFEYSGRPVKERFFLSLIRAINDYGYYAQQFLSQNAKETWTLGTDHAEMAKVNTTGYEYTAADLSDYAIRKELNDDLTAVSYSLTLDTDTAINLFFTPAQGYTGDVTAKLSNGKELKVVKTGGRYKVTIPGISAHLIGKTYDLTITTQTNGESTVSVSALSYAYACMEEGDPARMLMSAFYDYYLKAMAYKSLIDGQGQP